MPLHYLPNPPAGAPTTLYWVELTLDPTLPTALQYFGPFLHTAPAERFIAHEKVPATLDTDAILDALYFEHTNGRYTKPTRWLRTPHGQLVLYSDAVWYDVLSRALATPPTTPP